ncbi:hypothetical protein D9619_008273 [Psilocybe cf. subviscida]|uniref:NACHT domain-containing protein n=1 Tax=Psilocybe cf. subviscida TaxID=2480587 RepID=A0A8H5ET13_9AGAR|nr:hypothetical protein D9619_008273 [Psilocybe cf. subviscida]
MSMINLSHSQVIFTGGNYTQVLNSTLHRTPWDVLQSAAAPSAFHDSGDYFDTPKCHPNTRIAVMNELHDFALRCSDTGHAKILWLNGPAGAGKSAIARSLCEEFSATNSLVASFFFNRSDASRNNHKSFVATIAYQVYGHVLPHYQSLILGVIERDPLIFTRSVDTQFKALISVPLHDLFENGYFSINRKRLIVIDGLDECSTAAAQINILTVIQKISEKADFPFIFLIASRPEHEIQAFFGSSAIIPLLYQLNLNDSYLPDVDIERFLKDKLQQTRDDHPFKDSIPREWPSNTSIRALVRKSSGLFIYVSLAVKYITSHRHQPHKRLDYVLSLCPPKGDLPFAELDALYSHIFSCAEDINLALLIIGYVISDSLDPPSIEELAQINRLDPADCLAALCDLWSILDIQIDQYSGRQFVHILHKSLPDYLCDMTRSGKYHINTNTVLSNRVVLCLQYISDVSPEHRSEEEAKLFVEIFWDNFFFGFLNHLRTLVGTDGAFLYDRYVSDFRELCHRHPDVYTTSLTDATANKVAALVTLLILTEPPGSQMPSKVFASTASGPLTGSMSITSPYNNSTIGCTNLIHDATLQCFNFLKHDVNPISVAATLRYLAWVLPFAARTQEKMLEEGVGVDGLVVDENLPTGRAIIQVDKHGENSIILFPGANHSLLPDEQLLKLSSQNLDSEETPCTHLLLQNEIQMSSTLAALSSVPAGTTVILNPSPLPSKAEINAFPWDRVEWLIVNRSEAVELCEAIGAGVDYIAGAGSGREDDVDARELLEVMGNAARFRKTNIVCTLGAGGVLARPSNEYWESVSDADQQAKLVHVAAATLQGDVRDTTGAGDCFAGYFVKVLMDLSRGSESRAHIKKTVGMKELTGILDVCVVAAGMCVEKRGTIDSVPRLEEVVARMISLSA